MSYVRGNVITCSFRSRKGHVEAFGLGNDVVGELSKLDGIGDHDGGGCRKGLLEQSECLRARIACQKGRRLPPKLLAFK